MDHRVEQVEVPNHAGLPVSSFDIHLAQSLHDEVAELTESTEDDETGRSLLRVDVVLPVDVPALGRKAGLDESSAARALTAFRLRAFSGRGSPSA